MSTDRQDVTLLGLLDLSAAFDCVDDDILVDRLRQSFGMRCGTVNPVVPSWTDPVSLLRRCSVDVDGADLSRTTRLSLGFVAVFFVHRQAL